MMMLYDTVISWLSKNYHQAHFFCGTSRPLPYFADFLMSHYDEDTMVISEKASSLSLPDIWWAETEETPPTLRDQYVFQLFLDD